MPPQPAITEDSHQEVNTEHKILSTCPSSVLGLMTKETGKGVSYPKFTGICWMTNTLSYSLACMKCHPVVTDINFPALLIRIATNYCISDIHCTNQKLILLLPVRMAIPLWSVSPAQMKSGLYFLITNKLNARRWVKTPSVKMVGTIICHQPVSIKLSF